MKKALIFIIIFFVFCGLIITLLDVFGIWSITGTVREVVETHPRVQPYLTTAEKRAELEKEISMLREKLVRARGEKEELERINRSLEDLMGRYQEQVDELEERLEKRLEGAVEREENIRQLARIFSQMKPGEAAEVLKSLEDDLVIELFLHWEDRFAARVFAEMDSNRSARLAKILSE